MSVELTRFLSKYDTTGQKDDDGNAIYTHTNLQPRASYNIPMEVRSDLHRLIAQSVSSQKAVHLTERPMPVSSIKIDIDLKYPIDCSTRQHTDKHIKELLKLYNRAITTFVDLPEGYPLDAYVFQRSSPYPSKGNMKDGIHILYPDVCISTDIQLIIRTEILKKLGAFLDNPEIGILPVKNAHDEIVDLSVIKRNCWLMYGCCKPGLRPYGLYKIYRQDSADIVTAGTDLDGVPFTEQPVHKKSETDVESLINKLSIHQMQSDALEIRSEHAEYLEEFIERTGGRKAGAGGGKTFNSTAVLKKQIKGYATDDEMKCIIEEAKSLVKLLAPWRADSFSTWIEVGLCLHNISNGLYDAWVDFSKQSESYNANDESRWAGFSQTSTGLNIGSLHRWARLDSPAKYKELRSSLLEPLMFSSVSGVSQDMAMVIHKMYKHQFVCLDSRGNKWAEFVNHTWRVTMDGMSLKRRLGKEVLEEYMLLVAKYYQVGAQQTEENKETHHQRARALSDITYKLRDITFKEKVMKECIILFHDPKFEETLDANTFLVGLENGVYDLKEGCFRDGRPEDRVSVSTGNDYPDFDENDIDISNETSSIPEIQEIFDFMRQVFPIADTRRYMWISLSSYLQGYNTDEKFHIWTGTGGNGKSKLITLLEMAYGAYCFNVPIQVLTRPRGQVGQATPELAMGRKCRFGYLQEPEEGAKINTGLMKELSGNDKMFVRELYSSGATFKPQFSLVLLCNEKPKMTSDDDGSWRRLVVVDFLAKFVEGKPKGKYEFTRNTDLQHSFPLWAPYFFVLMTMWYKTYRIEGLVAPKSITEATKDYRKESDAYAAFIDEYIVPDPENSMQINDVYEAFKSWYSSEFNEKAPPRRNLKTYVERKLNKPYGMGTKAGWKGYAVRHPGLPMDNVGDEL
jgi:P4 family phage/plasmid primase-like protien